MAHQSGLNVFAFVGIAALICALAARGRQAKYEREEFISELERKSERLQESLERLRKSEMALRESEERLRLATSSSGIGIWEGDIESGEIEWSENTFDIIEVVPDRIRRAGKLFLSVVHPDDRAMVEQAAVRAIREHLNFNLEFRIIDDEANIQ